MRRIFAVLLFYPLFLILLIINWFFLLLDEIFFHSYRKQKIEKALFIIGVPRSATTYLFNLLYKDQQNFHGFKLWELILAPSVCQKYLFLLLKRIDRKIGNPVYKLSLLFDKVVFGKFTFIHDIGITKPEEDEVLFMYNFSSLYYFYFYPELDILDNFLYHDIKVPDHVKKKNMDFYYRCIQRHIYVFDRPNSKFFLSKNPTFIPRMESVALKFKNARFVYPLRSPLSTIPSTISLNANIMSNFCRLPEEYPLAKQTGDFILNWYVHADKVLKETVKERGLTIYYKDLITHQADVLNTLYRFLGINLSDIILPKYEKDQNYVSRHYYDRNVGIDYDLISRRLSGIIPAEILKNI